MKLISWNVNGLRAVFKKGLEDFVTQEKPDILCIQETKMQCQQFELLPQLAGYHVFSSSAEKKGYSGVATYISENHAAKVTAWHRGIEQKDFDSEGRFLIAKHPKFTLYNTYFPSGTTGEVRQEFKYQFLDTFYAHLNSLTAEQRSELIICGDYNICHKAIDIHHPETAEKRGLSGFLPPEREWMDKFAALGFSDSFRLLHQNARNEYSWWTFRAGARGKNLGWRIDYFFVGSKIAALVKKASILSSVLGSDHCPISLELKL